MNLDPASLISTWGLPAATCVYCFVSGLVPVVNTEAFLVIVSATLLTRPQLLVVAAMAALGQMTAKAVMYFVARTSFRRPPKKHEEQLAGARARLEQWRHGVAGFIFLSASTGFPPFYVVTILAGMMRTGFITFLIFGFAGRFVRFGVALLFPQFIKSLF